MKYRVGKSQKSFLSIFMSLKSNKFNKLDGCFGRQIEDKYIQMIQYNIYLSLYSVIQNFEINRALNSYILFQHYYHHYHLMKGLLQYLTLCSLQVHMTLQEIEISKHYTGWAAILKNICKKNKKFIKLTITTYIHSGLSLKKKLPTR